MRQVHFDGGAGSQSLRRREGEFSHARHMHVLSLAHHVHSPLRFFLSFSLGLLVKPPDGNQPLQRVAVQGRVRPTPCRRAGPATEPTTIMARLATFLSRRGVALAYRALPATRVLLDLGLAATPEILSID